MLGLQCTLLLYDIFLLVVVADDQQLLPPALSPSLLPFLPLRLLLAKIAGSKTRAYLGC